MNYRLCNIFNVIILSVIFLQGIHGRYSRNNEGLIRDYLLGHVNFTSTERPTNDSNDTVDVSMAMQIYAMIDLNEREQVVTTASWITLQWRDDRLSWNASEFGGMNIVNMFNNEIWTPPIFLSNAVDYDALMIVSSDRGSVVVSSDGVATLGTPLVLSTQCPLYIRYFPFDTQTCMFRFFPENFMEKQMRLLPYDSPDESFIGSREWRLVDLAASHHTLPYRNFAPGIPVANISLGVVCMYLERMPSYYIQTLWIPSTVLCLMTFATFLAPPDSGERVSLGVSMVLGLTVFQLLMSDILPAASEDPSLLSYYLSVNFILACLAVPFSLVNINIAYGDSRIIILRYRATRKLFLEYLPRIVLVSTNSQRLKNLEDNCERIGGSNQTNSEGNEPKMNGGVSVTSFVQSDHIDGEMSLSGGDIGATGAGYHGTETEEVKGNHGKAEREDLRTTKKQKLRTTTTDKTKMELRTVALVMDRIMLVLFLAVFLVFFLITIVGFQQNPGVADELRVMCG